MPNWKFIVRLLGILLYIEAVLMGVCLSVSVYYDEDIMPFVWAILIAVLLGTVGAVFSRGAGKNMSRKDGYIVVSIVWIVFSLVGMVPFLVDGCITDVVEAFFETVSGFTTTGFTVINDLDSVARGLLFWRSMTQWVGGIGIIFFTIAVLPAFGVGEVKLFAAEATGPLHDKIHPRISVTAKWIGTVYILLTLACFASLVLCDMDMFDAANVAITTTATGGFFTHSSLFHDVYNSASIEYVLTLFMLVSGVNFTLLYFTVLKGRIRRFFMDAELRCYMIIAFGAIILCTAVNQFTNDFYSLERTLREAMFTVTSLLSSTGLASCDYTNWHMGLMPVLLFLLFVGGCSGSTSGGFKCVRLSIINRVLKNEVTRILHPRAVVYVRMNDHVIPSSVIQTLMAFSALYLCALFGGAFLLCFTGADMPQGMTFDEAFGLSLSSLSNMGVGVGYFGPSHTCSVLSPMSQIVVSFLMLIGRLEMFPFFILLTTTFWRKG